MPRKKRNSTTITTTEKTNTKAEPKPSASRSKSKSVKPKKSPARPRKTSKSTTRSKSTTKRGRPSKSKAPAQLQDLSRESSVATPSPEPEKKKPGRKASSNIVEKSVGKSKKELKEEKASAKVTKTPGRPKSKGRSVSKAKAGKSTSRAPKAAKEVKEKEMKEEVQTRSARKSRKNEKKEERTPSPEPEPPKAVMTTPKRSRKNAKESKVQVTPATEKARTRVKASLVCKKEDTISERSEREDDHKGRSKKKEKKEKKAAIPSRTQAKMLQKKMKKEQVDLPRFPCNESSIEGLIVEAIKGLKTKAMEDRIIGYLGKRFSEVDGGNIKNVLQRMSFDEKLLLKGLGGGSVSCGKRDFDRAGGLDSMETSMIKKVKTSRNSSPAFKDLMPRGSRKMQTEDDRSDRYERKQNLSTMEIEMVDNTEVKNEDGSDASKKMEEEKAVEVTIKEEEVIPPIIIQEEEDIVLKLSASDSKKALIEYYERKLLGIRGLLTTDKKKNDVTPDPGMMAQQGITPNPVETPMPPGDVQSKEQQQEAKKEEQEEVRTTSVRRPELNESVEQIVSEKRNLSFDKEPLLDKKLGSGKGKENDEKIEEDEGRGMVIWELQESSVLEKTMVGTESLKETGQENGIELLMKLLTLPGVVTPDGADEQKMEETPQPRADEEKKVMETEKIEETAENKAAEVASTKTEPKVEETVEKAEEGAAVQKGGNAVTSEEDSLRKKMRSAVESYLEMLQGRIDLDYSRENGENTLLSTSEEGGVLQEKDMNKGQAGKNSSNKDADKKMEEDYVKEESDLERPQKLSVSKFLS